MSSIAVAMSVFNGELYLPEQLRSLAAQALAPSVVVVRDDASSDGSVALLREFARTAPFPVELLEGSKRLGAARSFELAIEHCQADAIALCDQDDIWAPAKLERLAGLLATNSQAGLAVTDGHLLHEGRRVGRVWAAFGADAPALRDPRTATRALVAPSIPGCSMAVSAALLHIVLPFPAELGDTNTGIGHDGWIVALASALTDVASTSEPLFDYRLHDGQAVGLTGLKARRGRIRARFRGETDRPGITERLRAAELVLERVTQHAENDSTRQLAQLLAHLRLRTSLPAGQMARWRRTWPEYRCGRYTEFSSGVLSFLSDSLPGVATFRSSH
jgi:glycosyltransferase involved in cell wall biosynthesis